MENTKKKATQIPLLPIIMPLYGQYNLIVPRLLSNGLTFIMLSGYFKYQQCKMYTLKNVSNTILSTIYLKQLM